MKQLTLILCVAAASAGAYAADSSTGLYTLGVASDIVAIPAAPAASPVSAGQNVPIIWSTSSAAEVNTPAIPATARAAALARPVSSGYTSRTTRSCSSSPRTRAVSGNTCNKTVYGGAKVYSNPTRNNWVDKSYNPSLRAELIASRRITPDGVAGWATAPRATSTSGKPTVTSSKPTVTSSTQTVTSSCNGASKQPSTSGSCDLSDYKSPRPRTR